MKQRIYFVLALLLTGSITYAQLTLSAEIRPRSELRHGFKTLFPQDADAAFFVGQRSRLNLGFVKGLSKAYVSLQDVRTWGDARTLTENANSTALHEGWADINLGKNLGLKIGRQEIAYDDQRMLGSVNWANQARSHDAAVLHLSDSLYTAHLGIAFNQSTQGLVGRDYDLANYKSMQYIWYNRKFGAADLSLLLLNLGFQKASEAGTNYQQTIGANFKIPINKVGLHAAAYYQLGENPAGTSVSAYDLALDASFKFGDFMIIPGLEILSGNDGSTADVEAFTPFFGTNHKFNGHMDYFYVGNHIGSVGLNNYYLKFKKKFNKVKAGLDLHYFAANQDLGVNVKDNYLGTEFDLHLKFPFGKDAAAVFGYSMMFEGESMEALKGIPGGETNYFSYLMIILKPSFTFDKNHTHK